MELLEKHMEATGDYRKSKILANEEADRAAEDQFDELRKQLSQIPHYKADGYCCVSKGELNAKDIPRHS